MMFTNFAGMARAAVWSAVLPLIVLFNGCAIGPPRREPPSSVMTSGRRPLPQRRVLLRE